MPWRGVDRSWCAAGLAGGEPPTILILMQSGAARVRSSPPGRRPDSRIPCTGAMACRYSTTALDTVVPGPSRPLEQHIMILRSRHRRIAFVSLAGYLLSGIAAALSHDHAGSMCCHGRHQAGAAAHAHDGGSAASSSRTVEKRCCRHATCKRPARAVAPANIARSPLTNGPRDAGSVSTKCAACEFLAQHVATTAWTLVAVVTTSTWREACPHHGRCFPPAVVECLARGPPA